MKKTTVFLITLMITSVIIFSGCTENKSNQLDDGGDDLDSGTDNTDEDTNGDTEPQTVDINQFIGSWDVISSNYDSFTGISYLKGISFFQFYSVKGEWIEYSTIAIGNVDTIIKYNSRWSVDADYIYMQDYMDIWTFQLMNIEQFEYEFIDSETLVLTYPHSSDQDVIITLNKVDVDRFVGLWENIKDDRFQYSQEFFNNCSGFMTYSNGMIEGSGFLVFDDVLIFDKIAPVNYHFSDDNTLVITGLAASGDQSTYTLTKASG